MGLNDEAEKLRQAKEWVDTCDVTSQQFLAAWDHVCHVYQTTKDFALRDEAAKIMTDTMGEDWLNLCVYI